MIDTDKYKGHTPAPWSKNIFGGLSQGKMPCNINLDEVSESDAKLIADAPLLLEEVKRLREENDELHAQRVQISWIQEARGGQSKAFELLAEVERLREENKEIEEFLNESHASNKIWHERLIRAQKWAYKQVCHNDSAMMDYDDYVWGEEND